MIECSFISPNGPTNFAFTPHRCLTLARRVDDMTIRPWVLPIEPSPQVSNPRSPPPGLGPPRTRNTSRDDNLARHSQLFRHRHSRMRRLGIPLARRVDDTTIRYFRRDYHAGRRLFVRPILNA